MTMFQSWMQPANWDELCGSSYQQKKFLKEFDCKNLPPAEELHNLTNKQLSTIIRSYYDCKLPDVPEDVYRVLASRTKQKLVEFLTKQTVSDEEKSECEENLESSNDDSDYEENTEPSWKHPTNWEQLCGNSYKQKQAIAKFNSNNRNYSELEYYTNKELSSIIRAHVGKCKLLDLEKETYYVLVSRKKQRLVEYIQQRICKYSR